MLKAIEKALEAFAVGDALGMPTEFLTRRQIHAKVGEVKTLLDPKEISPIHKELEKGRITDDTEQMLYLIEAYYRAGRVNETITGNALIKWVEETDADKKGYVGPGTLKALKMIKSGGDIKEAGKRGTTCGSAMRVGAVSLTTPLGNYEELRRRIYASSLITHNTNIAMESAMAVGYALHTAMLKTSVEDIMSKSLEGARIGREMSTFEYVGASTEERIKYIWEMHSKIDKKKEWLDFLYNVIGCGMEANEVVPVSMGIFFFSPENPWGCIKMGASIGGDTDTIAAISGIFSALYIRGHNIPGDILKYVLKINSLDLHEYAKMACDMQKKADL